MEAFVLLAGLYGLAIGSFISVYVWRTHSGEPIGRDRSRCPDCKTTLRVRDLIPVFSWLRLGGKCRDCKSKIPAQDLILEVVTAAAFAVTAFALGVPVGLLEWVDMFLWLAIVAQFIALATYDLRWGLLPDRMNLVLLVMVVLQMVLAALGGASVSQWLSLPLIGGVSAFAVFYGLYALGKGKWMGGGDVKLVFVLGLFLGGWLTLLGLMLAFNIAAFISVGLIVFGLRSRKDAVPFGPFLLLGAWTAALFGAEIIKWYLRMSGL